MKAAQIHDLLRLMRAARPGRVINYIRLRLSYYFSILIRRAARAGLPAFITIEPTNYCNLACRECPSGNGLLTRERGNISLQKYQEILEQVSASAMYITLYFQGEPFLHPDIYNMVQAARQKGMYVATSTNAQNMTPEHAEKVVRSGLDRIIISFDGPDQESYQTYRAGGSWKKVMEGVTNLVEAKKTMRSHTPFIVLQCLMLKKNEGKQNEIRQIYRTLKADRLEFKTLGLMDLSKPSDLLPADEKNSRYKKNRSGRYELKRKIRNRCFRAWSSCVITRDGIVVPCCYDKDARFVLGITGQEEISDIWKGAASKSFLNNILQARDKMGICRNCPE